MPASTPEMRKPTAAELKKFHAACEALNELGRAGFNLYLAMDSMHLMRGQSHNDSGERQEHMSAASHHIHNSGGGDW